jgi:hypothetical protein
MKPAKDSTLGKEKHPGTEAARSAPNPPPVNKPSPDALGVVRNLPAVFAGGAFHPPVAPARAVLDLQDELEHVGIVLGGVFALPDVACGRRVAGVKTHAVVDHRLSVGAGGFEPPASCSQSRRATRLRYAPWDGC